MLHGYIRCSTTDQNPQLQIDALTRFGVDQLWIEHRSAVSHRPELQRLLYSLRAGDHVVVWKLDRLARSLSDLLALLNRLEALGASIQSVTEPLDTSTPIGRMFIQLLGSFAEFERSMIRERCLAGMRAARERGVHIGRHKSVDRELIARLISQGMKRKDVARSANCGLSTLIYLLKSGQIPGHTTRPYSRKTK